MHPHLPETGAGSAPLNHLVNPDRIRQVVRRSFSGRLDEILGELFQNSQRAGATTVTITTSQTGFTLADDGHGIPETAESWHKLLCLAESAYQDETVETNQAPMGVGLHALLAHEGVSTVTLHSGHFALRLDTARWWHDPEYYGTWQTCLSRSDRRVAGLEITAEAIPAVVTQLRQELPLRSGAALEHLGLRSGSSPQAGPARGYAGWLAITLDGQPVETSPPSWGRLHQVLVETEYEGNRLTIGILERYSSSMVNWYGQAIKVALDSTLGFHLEVRTGRPVNPRSPTRQGLIQDQAWESLVAFIAARLQEFLFDPARQAEVMPGWIRAFCDWQPAAAAVCPYFIVARWQPDCTYHAVESLNRMGPRELRRKGEDLLLVRKEVRVALEGETRSCDFGLDSFLPLLEQTSQTPFRLVWGKPESARVRTLWWQPGPVLSDVQSKTILDFHEPGQWGLGTADHCEAWHPVGDTPVFVHDGASCWSIEDVDNWVIGTTDPIRFLEDFGRAGFDPDHDEYSYEEVSRAYNQSVSEVIRCLLGKSLSHCFSVRDLQSLLGGVRPVRLEFDYASDDQTRNPVAMLVTDAQGATTRVVFYD